MDKITKYKHSNTSYKRLLISKLSWLEQHIF